MAKTSERNLGETYYEMYERARRLAMDQANDPLLAPGNPMERIGKKLGLLKEGTKFDDGKARYDLLPAHAMEELVRVYTIGAKKYGDNNWRKGMKWGRVFRALLSHAFKFWWGESRDPEDEQHHMASVAWCALTLMDYEKEGIGEDDRWKYSTDSKN